MKRHVLKWRRPDAAHGEVEEYQLGEKRPPFLVILRNVTNEREAVRAVSEAHGKRLAGSPVICLPPGAEFELWEVDSGSEGQGR